MPTVPYPLGFTSIDEFPKARENLINIINIGGNRIVSRPGITPDSNGFGPCRGQIKFQDELYQISGTKLIKRLADGSIENISDSQLLDIQGTEDVAMAVGFTFLVFVVKSANGRGYAWDGTDLVEIMSPQFVPCIDVAYINGKWVYIPFSGEPAFVSDPLDPLTIQANAFFDAEEQPDKNTGVINFRNRLYIMGEDTTEVFRDTGTGDQPFRKIEGATIDFGLVSGKTKWGKTVLFLGNPEKESYGIFAIGSGTADRVSNEAVDELLNEEYTVDELKTCLAERFIWQKQDIAVFRLPRHTLYFLGDGRWGFFNSLATFEEKQVLNQEFKTWRAKFITLCYGQYFVGDVQTNDIGILTEVNDDYGDDIEKIIQTFARDQRGSYFTAKHLEMDGLTGQYTPEQTIGLSTSRDGIVFGPRLYIGMGALGNRTRRLIWQYPGGLGDYESFMGIQIQTFAPLEVASESLNLGT